MTVFVCQIEQLDAYFAGKPIPCPTCGERLNDTDPDAIFGHLLLHEPSSDRRADVTRAIANLRGWEHWLAAVRAHLRASMVERMSHDPELFAQLQRDGIIVKVSGKG